MQKAQGALEYLLLIGGAILVAVIVIALILNIGGSSEEETYLATAHALCAKYPPQECSLNAVTVKGREYLCFSYGPNTCRAASGLIAWYRLNENTSGTNQPIFDNTKNHQDGYITGPQVDCTVQGQFNSTACSFSGGFTGDMIRLNYSAINPKPIDNIDNADSFSISAWIYPTQNLVYYEGIIGKDYGDSWLLSAGETAAGTSYTGGSNNSLGFYVAGTRISSAANSIPLNTWTHVAGTFDGSVKTIYINGTQVGTQTVSVNMQSGTYWINIGGNGSGDEWKGKLDEITVWNRALTPIEVCALAGKTNC